MRLVQENAVDYYTEWTKNMNKRIQTTIVFTNDQKVSSKPIVPESEFKKQIVFTMTRK